MINNYLGTCSEVFISLQAVDLFCFLKSYSKTKFTCLKFTLELDNYLNRADSMMLTGSTSRTVTATSAEHPHRLHVHQDCKSYFHFSPPSPSAHCLSSREKMAEIAIQAERHRSWRVVRAVKSHCSTCMFPKHFFCRTDIYEHGGFTQPWLRKELFAHTNGTPSHHYKGKWMGYVTGRVRERNSWMSYSEM